MDSETFFYIVGGALVLIALAVSAIGMRDDDFPTTGVLRAGVALVTLVVAATAAGAVLSARAEQQHREDEENIEAAAEEEELTAENEEDGAGQPETPDGPAQGPQDGGPEPTGDGGGGGAAAQPSGDAEAGAPVFVENGCGSCHTLAAAGPEAVGEIGPNLDEALVDKDAAFIETAIVDPSAEVAEGFGDGIMPATFGSEIAPADLKNLVAYLSESTSGTGN